MKLDEICWKEVLKDVVKNKEKSEIPAGTVSHEHMKKAMQYYIDRINGIYHEGAENLFGEKYILKDPLGTRTLTIDTSFSGDDFADQDVIFAPQRAELVSPISTTYDNHAAMAFKLYMGVGDDTVAIDIIDVMTFNDEGKIIEVNAYWNRENVKVVEKNDETV